MFSNINLGITIVICLLFFNVNALLHLDMESDRFPLNRRIERDALDPELCERQLTHLRNETLLLARFLDAGIRVPRGILLGNTQDIGNFYQCLGINEQVEDMDIRGKYCRIEVPVNQTLRLPDFLERSSWNFDPSELRVDEKILKHLEEFRRYNTDYLGIPRTESISRNGSTNPFEALVFNLAICIPKPCTIDEAINGLLFNLSSIGFEYTDTLCRVPDDRPWVAADYIATVIFSIIGGLTLISTCYDLYESLYCKKDPKEIHAIYSSFSVYTNTRRLLTFNTIPDSLDCLDGIRVLAMLWVILGHSFFTASFTVNPIETFMWSISREAFWIIVAPLTVDTFFFLSGLLLVYTTAGKIKPMGLLKNLHIFYLHRLLRMFPILAAVILFESSFYMRVSDGALWDRVAVQTYKCREFWWSTLLHLQNIVNPREACIGVTWYLAIDMQLHILSPLVLFWVLTNKKAAWTALNVTLIATLAASTTYIFIRNFPSGIISPNRRNESVDFYIYYYVNILTRASPFVVGMLYGYLLHLWRNKKAYVPKVLTTVLLLNSLLLLLVVMYCSQIAVTLEWDNQLADNLFNSFLRPLWALALGWVVFACAQGRAGPINWFLSLRMWKLPARISYAMYLTHFSIMVVFYSTPSGPFHFSVPIVMFNFFAFYSLTFIISFFVTLLIDSPFSTIFKQLLGSPKKQPNIKNEESSLAKNDKIGIANTGFTANTDIRTDQVSNLKLDNEEHKINVNGSADKRFIEENSKSKELKEE